ncbi:SDR family oxidoreductase [Nitratireductor basaltis]|uniref:Short chain dehydrogenase n=1 Tax=Nitratireductor basaltis TaxID=472175 RepID=A0A084UC34_9HYPH|nr:SDR family oxidoreductase [Nitratireductor basaltis]KFB10520.1 Short chain dehydrogenase [Nitratireductor basaltis]
MQNKAENILITGAAKRIGRAMALDLAASGFGVAVHYNGSHEAAEEVVREITSKGGRAAAVQADLSDSASAAGLVEEAKYALGPLSVVVNNASLFEEDSVHDFDDDGFDAHMAVHVKAPALITRSFARQLDGKPGLVVNIIDERVWKLTPRYFTYTLSKAALWTATRTLAQALAPDIRVNAIGPGPTLPNQKQDDDGFRRQTEALLLERGPALKEFAATVEYLWRMPSITGQMIALDGGQHLAWQTPDAEEDGA